MADGGRVARGQDGGVSMYTCPACGSHDVNVRKTVAVVERWTGENVAVEEVPSDGPETGTMECAACGEEFAGDLFEFWE